MVKRRFFYGWYVVASCFAIMFFISGARYSFGVMFRPMLEEFGWSRGAISLAFFINMASFALSLMAVGRLCDRFGPRRVVLLSTLFLSLGYSLIFVIRSLWQFYVFYGLLAGTGLGGMNIPLIAVLTSHWFNKWRSFAISLILSGGCLGQFALLPVFMDFTQRYGWRTSYLAIGLIMFVVNITLGLFVIKDKPESGNERALGAQEQKKGIDLLPHQEARDLGLGEAMRSHSFWLFAFVMFVCGSGDFLVTTHLIPFVTDCGISAATAGNMLAWYGMMSLVGILIAGPASDLIGNKIPLAIAFLLRFLSFLLVLQYQTQFSFYVFSMVFGMTYLVAATLTTTVLGKLFGYTHIGFISGFISTVHHFAGGFWAYMGGLVFDHTGSYRLIFVFSAVLALMASLSSMFMSQKRVISKEEGPPS